ncbi:MAG TPA: GNAT family N-acetyltransferase [Methanomicrobia archaeon]|nr:GNAT family N-acetyltransferase [Methanomicrobia archaeon]
MRLGKRSRVLNGLKARYPEKFAPEDRIFGQITRGARIFIGTGCGEPQYLVGALIRYAESHPTAIFDAEVFHVWTLGVAPYTDEKFRQNFRHNSFFIGNNTREAINRGLADYTPIFLSEVPDLFARRIVPVDVALVQTSPPDEHGYMSFGVSVDIVKAATEKAELVIAQVNSYMPRVHGDSFIHIDNIDFVVPHDEPLLEYTAEPEGGVAQRLGEYVARLIQNGDTIQVGYGSIPNAILANLQEKQHLGVHTELISDGLVDLMKRGVIDNSKKTLNRGKAVATFCMGRKKTYAYIHDNPAIEFRTIDYTNNPLIIAQHEKMTAINTALEIDLTGQATAESLGKRFYSGIGGQADFMRGAVLAKHGKAILAIPATAEGGTISRIVPFLKEGAGVTLNRGDVQYVVTEYGIAYLHGKNIRERAMELIAVAHPQFQPWLIEEARKLNLIYSDQAFIPGVRGEYPAELETYRRTKTGLDLKLRPVKISDEPLLKDFFYALSDDSLYQRFFITRRAIHHDRLQEFAVIDYTTQMVILAVLEEDGKEEIVGLGQYAVDEATHTADVGFAVRDEYQNRGIGSELLRYLTILAKRKGLLGFTAQVLLDNPVMMHVFERAGFDIEKSGAEGVYDLKMLFRKQ